eukprot:SAG31_NODE_11612_length_1013_cov_1.463895_1_plen_91_part_10
MAAVAQETGKPEAALPADIVEGKNPLATHHFLHDLLDCCAQKKTAAGEPEASAADAVERKELSVEVPGESAGGDARSPGASDFNDSPNEKT